MNNKLYSLLIIFCLLLSINANAQIPDNAEDICPLLIGETLPAATLQNADGEMIRLKEVLNEGPTILVFYRGGWCPYCNLQLSGLVDIEEDILELGYQIVAISPDEYQNLKVTEEKDKIKYKLFSDPVGKLIQDVGIAFQTSKRLKGIISKKDHIGKISEIMPVPTVMIVDKQGVIQFEYINPNYKIRISGELLLGILKQIKK